MENENGQQNGHGPADVASMNNKPAMTETSPRQESPAVQHKRQSRRTLREVLFTALPRYTGRYDVSALDIEVPVSDALNLKEYRHGPKIETVLFTLYYPTVGQGPKGTPRRGITLGPRWLSTPQLKTAAGYADFLGASRPLIKTLFFTLIGLTRLPTTNGTPPLNVNFDNGSKSTNGDAHAPPSGNATEGVKSTDSKRANGYPVVIFSHGLGGTRTNYSQFCGELASHGTVVASIEHRDGSSPNSYVTFRDANGKSSITFRPYIKGIPEGFGGTEFRASEINQRVDEVRACIDVLKKMNEAKTGLVNLRSGRDGQTASAMPDLSADFQDTMDFKDRLIMSGHSFGGATAVEVVRRQTLQPNLLDVKFRLAVLLDPWMEPLDPPVDRPIPVGAGQSENLPVISINSSNFTDWSGNFRLVKDLFGGAKAYQDLRLYSIRPTPHPAQSDFPSLFPKIAKRFMGLDKVSAGRAMELNRRLALGFLGNWLERSGTCIDPFERDLEAEAWITSSTVGKGEDASTKLPPEVERHV